LSARVGDSDENQKNSKQQRTGFHLAYSDQCLDARTADVKLSVAGALPVAA
jgi:hypothetical protein